ncbi:uncharacterized protein V1516DRAFT_159112 [Lipomyces oligophaga]|uniref:uncharacterized protein n=1 Tax=Lipomyces oligophaga TaxID=45792 RepID=UPI0034CF3A29
MDYGDEGENSPRYVGQSQISKKFMKLDIKDCKVLLSNIDSQPSNDGFVIQVLGEMSIRAGPSQKFVQTFFLAEQNVAGKPNYYVLNDIFRFLKEDVFDDEDDRTELQDDASDGIGSSETADEGKVFVTLSKEQEEEISEAVDDGAAVITPVSTPAATAAAAAAAAVVSTEKSSTPGPLSVEQDEAEIMEEYASHEIAQNEPVVIEPEVAAAVEVEAEDTSPTAEPEPEVEVKPSGPVSWAALAARRSAAAAAAAVVPTAVSSSGTSTATVAASSAAPAEQIPESNVTTTASKSDDTHKKREFYSAYIKGVNDKVSEKGLRDALSKFGTLKHFEVSRNRSCAFVDFGDAAQLEKALQTHTLPVGEGIVVYVEERRRGGATTNNGNNRPNGGQRRFKQNSNTENKNNSGNSNNNNNNNSSNNNGRNNRQGQNGKRTSTGK